MIFALLTLFSALSLAAVADWFAIVGIMSIYAGAPYHAALVMGIVLAFAKIVNTSWLYREWKYSNWKLKIPLIGFTIALMVATSIGTFGFLTKSHLEQGAATVDNTAKVERLDQQIAREKSTIADDEKVIAQLDTSINSLIGKDRTDRALAVRRSQAPQRKQLRDDIDTAQKKIDTYSDEKLKLTSEVRALRLEVGPIRYIAELFYGSDGDETKKVESAVKMFTALIISTLDPLAIIMLIAANQSILRRQDEKKQKGQMEHTPAKESVATQPINSFYNKEPKGEVWKIEDITSEIDEQVSTHPDETQQQAEIHVPVPTEIVDKLDEETPIITNKNGSNTIVLSEIRRDSSTVSPAISALRGTGESGYIQGEEIQAIKSEEETTLAQRQTDKSVRDSLPSSIQEQGVLGNELGEGNEETIYITWPKLPRGIQVNEEKENMVSTQVMHDVDIGSQPEHIQDSQGTFPITDTQTEVSGKISELPEALKYEEEASDLERFTLQRENTPLSIIRTPSPTRVAFGDADPEVFSEVENKIQDINPMIPWEQQSAVMRELIGNVPHFIPQKVNEEKRQIPVEESTQVTHAGEEGKTSNFLDISTALATISTNRSQTETEEIPGEASSFKEDKISSLTVLEERNNTSNRGKYPKALSWLKEFKGN